jgi:hypothetical protein
MRRTLIIALGSAVALATAAVAIAVTTVSGISETTATFTASTVVDHLKTRTCDTAPYAVIDGQYSGGTITFADATLALDGPLKIRARTTLNTTTGLGYVEGSFRVKDDDSRLSGRFSGTLKGGVLVGFLTGSSHGNHAKVLGNISAPFVPATGFASGGALGTGSTTSALAVIAGPVCKGERHEPKGPKPDKPARPMSVEGVATIIPPVAPAVLSTITVTPKHGPVSPPCVIPAAFSIPTGVVTGAKVEMQCELVGTAPTTPLLTLTKLKLHK